MWVIGHTASTEPQKVKPTHSPEIALIGDSSAAEFRQRLRSDKLRLADGIVLGERPNELQRAELTTIGTGDANDLRPQRADGHDSCRLLVEWRRRNLQRQACSPREIAACGQHGASAAYIQDRREIQKVLPLIVNSARKNWNRKRKPFPFSSLLGVFQFRYPDKRVNQRNVVASTMPNGKASTSLLIIITYFVSMC